VPPLPPSDPAAVAKSLREKLAEIAGDAAKATPNEVRDWQIGRIEKMMRSLDPTGEDMSTQKVINLIFDSDAEFHMSKYAVTAQAFEGLGTTLQFVGAAQTGKEIAYTINDYRAGKIDGVQLVQKLGPIPMKFLVANEWNIPFADQLVDAGIAIADTGLDKAIDAGVIIYERYKGYKGRDMQNYKEDNR
jgi:hypothetical protein